MSRSRFFAGLAAAVLLVGAASLAQAQNYPSYYWNTTGPADWTSANWTIDGDSNYFNGASVIIMAERPTSARASRQLR